MPFEARVLRGGGGTCGTARKSSLTAPSNTAVCTRLARPRRPEHVGCSSPERPVCGELGREVPKQGRLQ
eukprot:14374765-Alexandrium_andersonii.AAC.1